MASGVPLGGNVTTDTPEELLFEGEGEGGNVEEQVVVRGAEVLQECVVPEDAEVIQGDDSAEGEVRWYHDGTRVSVCLFLCLCVFMCLCFCLSYVSI